MYDATDEEEDGDDIESNNIGMDMFDDIAQGNDDDVDVDNDIETTNCITDNNIARVTIGSRQITNIRVPSLNKDAFRDVIKHGRLKMKKENLYIKRKRKAERQERYMDLRKSIYMEINASNQVDNESSVFAMIDKMVEDN